MSHADTTTGDRQLDTVIAKMLGLEVLGQVPCRIVMGNLVVDHYGSENKQPVYLGYCYCNTPEYDDGGTYFDHSSYCLKVVPLYHRSDTLARQVLEQICDERDLLIRLYRDGDEWIVKFLHSVNGLVAWDHDKSFRLAICKALAGLGEVTKC